MGPCTIHVSTYCNYTACFIALYICRGLSDTFIHHVIKEATLDKPLMVIFLSSEHNRFTVAVPSSLDTSLLQQSTIYNNTHQVISQISFICYNL